MKSSQVRLNLITALLFVAQASVSHANPWIEVDGKPSELTIRGPQRTVYTEYLLQSPPQTTWERLNFGTSKPRSNAGQLRTMSSERYCAASKNLCIYIYCDGAGGKLTTEPVQQAEDGRLMSQVRGYSIGLVDYPFPDRRTCETARDYQDQLGHGVKSLTFQLIPGTGVTKVRVTMEK